MNLFDPIERYSQNHPEKTAIVFSGMRVSYGDFYRNVNRLSAGLERLGLKKGDRIALLMNSCPEMMFAFYAALKLGAISVSLNVMFKKQEADYILDDATPSILVAQMTFLPLVKQLGRVKDKKLQVVIVGDAVTMPDGAFDFETLLKDENQGFAATLNLGPEDEAVIGYTSGTTGFPKGAVHTHRNILMHLDGMSQALGFADADIFLAALPFFQLTAFLVHAGLAFHVGATLVVMEKFEVRQFVHLIQEEKVTFFAAVPTIFQMLYDGCQDGLYDLGCLRFAICAGSPLSIKLRTDFENKMKLRIIHCYGSTETPLIASFERPDQPPKGISVGNISPHVNVRLVKPDGSPAGVDEAGEIQIHIDNALKCYWNNPEATQEAIKDGWFATGDIGKIDPEGLLHIVDRAKDMIIRGGFNIYPAEIEKVLLSDPRIKDAAVVGEHHKRLGEIPKAYVVLEEGAQLTPEDVISLSREKLANFKVLEKVEFVSPDFFPRNALGKIQKAKLRHQVA
jgi:long-chain acyl-CoA synthetase